MEEATADLRNAIHLALNDGKPTTTGTDDYPNDVLIGCSEGKHISSLPGSLPYEHGGGDMSLSSRMRMKYSNNAVNKNNHLEEIRRLMEVASGVENAVSNYEMAAFNLTSEIVGVPPYVNVTEDAIDDANEENRTAASTIDLIIAAMTSVPRHLLQKRQRLEEKCRGDSGCEELLVSMEDICFNAACISSDVVVKYFLQSDNELFHSPGFEDRHVYELIDEVIAICEASASHVGWSIICPIVRVLNSVSESHQIDRAIFEREGGCLDDLDHHPPVGLFTDLTGKDTLRLVQMLLQQFIFDNTTPFSNAQLREEVSSHVGLFAGYMLDHFANVVLAETGYPSFDDCQMSLFEAWANGADVNMTKRLNDNDTQNIPNLIAQFQIESIQSALHLLERAESVIGTALSEDEKAEGAGEDCIAGAVAAVQDMIRQGVVVVSITEAMDKLNLAQDHEAYVIFHPLIVTFARFNASLLREALLLFRKTDGCGGEGTSNLADDMLFRMCNSRVGLEFLSGDFETTEQDDVLSISLLRSLSSQCIAGKSKVLLDIVSDRANRASEGGAVVENEPFAKRQRISGDRLLSFPSGLNGTRTRTYEMVRGASRREMTDILLTCMAISQSNAKEGVVEAIVQQTSCIGSSLMSKGGESGDDNGCTVLDSLNPWHTLQIDFLRELTSKLEQSSRVDGGGGYSSSVPSCFDTKATFIHL